MSWKECYRMEQREKFIQRYLAGERMSELCDEFEISRKTGYKFYSRYLRQGLAGLADLSRRPKHSPLATPEEIRRGLITLKLDYPNWGAGKIREIYIRRQGKEGVPSRGTVHHVLDQKGLVKHRRHRRRTARTRLTRVMTTSEAPNEIWCTDFKGQFRLTNGRYCYPLTITDHYSRFLLGCQGQERISALATKKYFEEVFQTYGLPNVIRSDNGSPFAGTNFWGLSRLSVWWLKLGIELERIQPGHPEQNGRHERMHRTLKQEATHPRASNIEIQQKCFDQFKRVFNEERPHEALEYRTPDDLYHPKERWDKAVEEPTYPECEIEKRVSPCGHMKVKGNSHKIFLSEVLGGENVGLKEIDHDLWCIRFGRFNLGYYDCKTLKFKPLKIHYGPGTT